MPELVADEAHNSGLLRLKHWIGWNHLNNASLGEAWKDVSLVLIEAVDHFLGPVEFV